MTIPLLVDRLYNQLDLAARNEAKDKALIRKAFMEAQAITTHGSPLDALMDNTLAWRLGELAEKAGCCRKGCGDHIDRGLILLRLLNKNGFALYRSLDIKPKKKRRKK